MPAKSLLRHRPLLVLTTLLIGFFLLPLLFWIFQIRKYTGGLFIYPVDDAYIHLQVARNLAQSGTWGLNAGEFASASSSPLYTIVLALCMKVFGNTALIPLFLNSILSVVLIFLVTQWLLENRINSIAVFVIVGLVIFFTPLPVIALSGMEHVLQLLFCFLFLRSFHKWHNYQNIQRLGKLPFALFLFAAAMVSTRYENFFLLLPVVLIMMKMKSWGNAALLLLVASLPVLLFGIYAVYNGSYIVPNSLLVKTSAGRFSLAALPSLINDIIVHRLSFAATGITLLATQRLLLLIPLAVLLVYNKSKEGLGLVLLLGCLWVGTLLHLALADTGKFYRYEAYLVFHALLLTGVIVYQSWPVLRHQFLLWHRLALLVAFVFCLVPLVLRSFAGFSKAHRACINIYEQQFQMARFLQANPDIKVAAANDIGAVAYYSNSYILDLWGLGNIETARSKKNGYWNAAYLSQLATQKQTNAVMIYDSWINKSIPSEWVKVGEWQIFNNVVCGDDFVSFYALNAAEVPGLLKRLHSFEKALPATVAVHYEKRVAQ